MKCIVFTIATRFLLLLWINVEDVLVEGAVACTDTRTCIEMLRPGSECVNGFCTNPFHNGCLRNFLGEGELKNKYKKRVCNSHDTWDVTSTQPPADNDEEYCIPPLFNYQEIRISNQNWESAMFTAWLLQIILSELLGVPASIETTGAGRNMNFYDLHNSFSYGSKPYDYEGIRRGQEVGYCTKIVQKNFENANNEDYEYESCVHVIPETWNGQASTVFELEANGVIENAEGGGVVGKMAWYVPRYLARQDSTLLSYIGMEGDENRKKVATTFNRPTNWKYYCQHVSKNNCTLGDTIAARAPQNEAEGDRYFVEGLYKGHFRVADHNDCSGTNITSCTGHICDIPCDWSTFATQQIHHLKMPLQSDGPLEPNGGYTYGNMMDIWLAANATKSPVLYYWWIPDPMYQLHLGTESEFTMVQLPPPSQECVLNRVSPTDRCSSDFEDNIGHPLGSCDTESHSLLKLIVSNLYTNIKSVPYVEESPAYEAIKAFTLTELQIGQIFDYWAAIKKDHWNYDPREATCRWVVENLYYLETLIPRTYPRRIQEVNNHGKPFFTFAFAAAVIVSSLIASVTLLITKYRHSPVMEHAQIGFLYILLFGLFLVSIGSITLTVAPTDGYCGARAWFITLGYTLELVPLIVKVGAINKMMQAAQKMKRLRLSQTSLYKTVAIVVILVTIYLTLWTILDRPLLKEALELTERTVQLEDDQHEHTIIQLAYFCASKTNVWQYVAVAWQCMLLVSATVLAYQTRNLRQDFNESQTMAFMIYSHFVFVSLQAITFALTESLQPDTLEACRSIIYSVDAVVAMQVYFVPKLYKAYSGTDLQEKGKARISFSLNSSVPVSTTRYREAIHNLAHSQAEQADDYDCDNKYSIASRNGSNENVFANGNGNGNGGHDPTMNNNNNKQRHNSSDIVGGDEEKQAIPVCMNSFSSVSSNASLSSLVDDEHLVAMGVGVRASRSPELPTIQSEEFSLNNDAAK